MAFNVRSGGKAESVEVPETVVSGNLVRVDELVGIAEIDAFEGPDGNFYTTVALEGIAHATITGAVTAGAALYTATAGPGAATLTVTGTGGNKPVGYATRDKGTGEGEVWFKLVPNVTLVA